MEFDIIANNGQINSALAETKRRVQGFTDATVEGGDRMIGGCLFLSSEDEGIYGCSRLLPQIVLAEIKGKHPKGP